MFNVFLFVLIVFSFVFSSERDEIVLVLQEYNKAFGDANYSEIIKHFDLPASFNLQNKTISASNRLKLKLIYKKIRGDLPDYYSYSKWGDVDIQLIDEKIAIVNADFSRYKSDNTIFSSGSAQYHLRLVENEWRFFSLTPYTKIKTIDE